MGCKVRIYCGNCLENSVDYCFEDHEFDGENIIKSKNSAFNEGFSLGGGFISPDSIFYCNIFENPLIYGLVEEEQIKNDIKLLIKNEAKVIDAYHAIYYCSNCLCFYNKYYFKMELRETYEPKYYCKYCKNVLEHIFYDLEENKVIFKKMNEEKIKILCKKCGSDYLLEDYIADWD